jgi:hypothetical protein
MKVDEIQRELTMTETAKREARYLRDPGVEFREGYTVTVAVGLDGAAFSVGALLIVGSAVGALLSVSSVV